MTVLSGFIPAMKHQFQTSRHKGCYFHMCQAFRWRVVDTDELQKLYRTIQIVRRYGIAHMHNCRPTVNQLWMGKINLFVVIRNKNDSDLSNNYNNKIIVVFVTYRCV